MLASRPAATPPPAARIASRRETPPARFFENWSKRRASNAIPLRETPLGAVVDRHTFPVLAERELCSALMTAGSAVVGILAEVDASLAALVGSCRACANAAVRERDFATRAGFAFARTVDTGAAGFARVIARATVVSVGVEIDADVSSAGSGSAIVEAAKT